MKIKLNKQHLNIAKGQEIEVTPEEAEYFKRMGMVAKDGEVKPAVVHKKHK